MPRGRVIGDAPIILGSICGRRRRRLDDVDNSGWQRTQACRTAALRSRGLMRFVSWSRRLPGDMPCVVVAIGLAEVRMSGGVFVHMTAVVGVLRRSFANNALTVVSIGMTYRRP